MSLTYAHGSFDFQADLARHDNHELLLVGPPLMSCPPFCKLVCRSFGPLRHLWFGLHSSTEEI